MAAFESFSPGTQNLGNVAISESADTLEIIDTTVDADLANVIEEGVSYRRTFVVKTDDGSGLAPKSMVDWDTLPPTVTFKNATTEDSGTTVGSPQGAVCAWTNSPGGEFTLDLTAAATNALTGANSGQVFRGYYEIVVHHETETEAPSATPKTTIVFRGAWRVRKTATAA